MKIFFTNFCDNILNTVIGSTELLLFSANFVLYFYYYKKKFNVRLWKTVLWNLSAKCIQYFFLLNPYKKLFSKIVSNLIYEIITAGLIGKEKSIIRFESNMLTENMKILEQLKSNIYNVIKDV